MVRTFRRAAISVLTLMLVASLAPGSGSRSTVLAAPTSGEQRAVDMTAAINQLVGVRWKALVQEDESLLDSAYSSTATKLLNSEKVKLVKHFMVPMRQGGHKYVDYQLDLKIGSVAGTSAKVEAEVLESVSFRWGPEGSKDLITSSSKTPHRLTLVQEGGRWVIGADDYDDEFRYLKALDHPEQELPALRAELQRLKAQPPKQSAKPFQQFQTKEEIEGKGVAPEATSYNRTQAVSYAETYAEAPNPQYVWLGGYDNGGDCTNFASQVLWRGGGLYDYSGKWQWWYNFNGTLKDTSDDRWSDYTWALVHSFYLMLKENARLNEAGPKATDMYIGAEQWNQAAYDFLFQGDFIQYDKDGNGTWDHTAVVTGWTTDNPPEPLISQHSSNAKDVGWRKGARSVRLLHITTQN
jgi:hypothetical protein